MATIRWNKATRTYTVSNGDVVVRGIITKSQAQCVKIDLKYGWHPSFGEIDGVSVHDLLPSLATECT